MVQLSHVSLSATKASVVTLKRAARCICSVREWHWNFFYRENLPWLQSIHNLTTGSVPCRPLLPTFTTWTSIQITPLTLLLPGPPQANSGGHFWFPSHLSSQQYQWTQSLFLETFSSLSLLVLHFPGFLPTTHAASYV